MNLSIFTSMKPNTDDTTTRAQRNAVRSWLQLKPTPQIIIIGDDAGIPEICSEFGLRWLPDLAHTSSDRKSTRDLFAQGQAAAVNDIVAYVNADMILLSDFLPAVDVCATVGGFLMVGFRWNVSYPHDLDFRDADWESRLVQLARDTGELNQRGSDYFVFPRGMYDDVPPFNHGCYHWDGWLMGEALRKGVELIDATEAVFAVHQSHQLSWGGSPEAKENYALLHDTVAWPQDATMQLANGKLVRVR